MPINQAPNAYMIFSLGIDKYSKNNKIIIYSGELKHLKSKRKKQVLKRFSQISSNKIHNENHYANPFEDIIISINETAELHLLSECYNSVAFFSQFCEFLSTFA